MNSLSTISSNCAKKQSLHKPNLNGNLISCEIDSIFSINESEGGCSPKFKIRLKFVPLQIPHFFREL